MRGAGAHSHAVDRGENKAVDHVQAVQFEAAQSDRLESDTEQLEGAAVSGAR